MKPIILNNINAMTSADVEKSLPVAISLVEYSSNLGNETSTLECLRNDDDHNGDGHNKGTLGNMFLSYSIDCKHGIINRKEGTDELLKFKYIEDKITSMKCPTFSRRFLADNFFIYAIPDYSRQAMTPGFSDMVVVIYTTEGRKVPQRYIGMIKSYTQEMCYVLVDKSIQKLDSFETFEESDHKAKTFEIRIKQNAETDPEVAKDDLTLINDPQDYFIMHSYPVHAVNGDGTSYVYDQNDVFLDGDVISEASGKSQRASRTIVNAQAQYGDDYTDDNGAAKPGIKDYFKQVLLIDYDKDGTHGATVQRPNEVAYDYNETDLMRVYSAQRIPEFFDTNVSESSDTGKIFKITATVQNEYEENFEVFDSMTGCILIPHIDFEYEYTDDKGGKGLYISGIKIKPGNNINAIEILPYYDAHRRIRLYGRFIGDTVPTTKADVCEKLTNFLNNSCIDANIDEYTLRMYSESGMLIDTLGTTDVPDVSDTTTTKTPPTYFVLSDFEHNVAFPTSRNKLGNNGGFVLGYRNAFTPSDIKPNLRGTVKEYNCFSLYPGQVNDKELCDHMEIYSNDVGNNVYLKHEEVYYATGTKCDVYNLNTDKLKWDNTPIKYTADGYVNDVANLKNGIETKRHRLSGEINRICNSLCEKLSKIMKNSNVFANIPTSDIKSIEYSSHKSCAFICIKLDSELADQENAICWERSGDNPVSTEYVNITPQDGYYVFPILKEYQKITLRHGVEGQLYFFDGRGDISNG